MRSEEPATDEAPAAAAPAPFVDVLRDGCCRVARSARHLELRGDTIPAYAASLPPAPPQTTAEAPDPEASDPETAAAYWLTLDAINFGSGWFPTLRKRDGRTGYRTISGGLTDRFRTLGAWSAEQLAAIDAPAIATVTGQDHDHPLMELFATSLRDLGTRTEAEYAGSFAALADCAGGSAVGLAGQLGAWPCFADTARLDGIELPFRKRAQIAAADLARAGVIPAPDLGRLTMFADNLVPHVLRLDGVLAYAPDLLARIEAGALLEPGSREEVEIRACAVHAVELIAAERPAECAAEVDELLWNRGQGPRYKAQPRHRCRCTAY